jgi:hypothetical protein
MNRQSIHAIRLAIVLAAAVGLAVLSPGVAFAGGNGATASGGPLIIHDCQDDGTTTLCYDVVSEYHSVCTPAGGCNIEQNYRSECGTVTDDATQAVLFHGCTYNEHFQIHTDETGAVQVLHFGSVNVITVGGVTECFTFDYHESRGVVQYDRFVPTAC